ncbi:MAG: hypothetical protein ACYTKD_23555 [Planctomycetota bacterium]|jgi:chromosome segregation ATPase
MRMWIAAAAVVGALGVAGAARAEAAPQSRKALEEELAAARIVMAIQAAQIEELQKAAPKPTAAPKTETPDERKTREELIAQIQVLRTERNDAVRENKVLRNGIARCRATVEATSKRSNEVTVQFRDLKMKLEQQRHLAEIYAHRLKRAGIPLPR